MRFDKPRHFRQSMSWLHTWTGLLFGWLLFAVFVTGTLSFFREEISFWMQPELHHAHDDDGQGTSRALAVLAEKAPQAEQWWISLPGSRSQTLSLMWRNAESERQSARPNRGRGGSRGGTGQAQINPATGEVLLPRETSGGNFFYRFHFELYGIDRIWGRWVVGIATFFMLVAIITGVIMHKNIFRDFFTFRPAKGKRSWLDAHNASAVLSLPFHFIITFSGLLLLGSILMPTALDSAYKGDFRAFAQELRGRTTSPIPPASAQVAPLADIRPLLAVAHQYWPDQTVGSVSVIHPGRANAMIELRQSTGNSLTNRGEGERLQFDGTNGRLIKPPAPSSSPSAILATWNTVNTLHMGRFASPLPRWLLFVSGIGGSLMVASGLLLWVISRTKEREKLGYTPRGHRLVEIFNIAAVAGLLVAIGAYFWANRLLPAEFAARSDWEIRIFFIVWATTLFHAALRRHKTAWVEELAAAATLTLLLPVLNGLTGGAHLGSSITAGQWQVAGFDLCALALGILLIFTMQKVILHTSKVRMAKNMRPPLQAPAIVPEASSSALPSPLFARLQQEENR